MKDVEFSEQKKTEVAPIVVRPIHHFFAFALFLMASIASVEMFKPLSLSSFLGPAAAVASALVLVWRAQILFSVFLALLTFSFYTVYVKSLPLDPAVIIICAMAIFLQAIWTKQLGYRFVAEQKWLDSREKLLYFIIKIGPVASIVCGTAATLVAVLDAKLFTDSLFYGFFASWGASLLVVLFVTPPLLFTQGEQKLNVSKRSFVLVASFLGCFAIGLLITTSQKSHQHSRFDSFEHAKNTITSKIDHEIESIDNQMNALSALFIASEGVTSAEFANFAGNFYKEDSTVRALQWVPYVDKSKKALFESIVKEQLGYSYNIDANSAVQRTNQSAAELFSESPNQQFLPVMYLYPYQSNVGSLGIDLMTQPEKQHAFQLSAITGKSIASAPVTLPQDSMSNPGIVIFLPLYEINHANLFGQKEVSGKSVSGYIVAVSQFLSLFKDVYEEVDEQHINFTISDVTASEPFRLFGESIESEGRLHALIEVNVFARKWHIEVAETRAWDGQEKSWQSWAFLIGGSIGGLFFQLLILMMAAYSTELTNKVENKTRELIVAKNISDKANDAKSKFLETLSVESKSSINVIYAFVENARNKNAQTLGDQNLSGIKDAAQTLEHIVNNLSDLNSIETGEFPIEAKVTDLRAFVDRMESMFKATTEYRKQSIAVVLGKNVPHYIETDEYRVQQFLSTMIEHAFAILKSDDIRLSIKAHLHQLANTTIFFLVTVGETEYSEPSSLVEFEDGNDQLETHSISMAMVKEVCQLLGGDATIVDIPSGEVVISASIKVELPAVTYQNNLSFGGQFVKKQQRKNCDILLVSEDEKVINELNISAESLGRTIGVCSQQHDAITYINNNRYKLLIIDGDASRLNAIHLAQQVRRNEDNDNVMILGVFSSIDDEENILMIKSAMNAYIEKPINLTKFHYYLEVSKGEPEDVSS